MTTHTTMWHVDVFIEEDETHTPATARLHSKDRTQLSGRGTARRNPVDVNVPEIGEELAVARALTDLGHTLIETAAADIEGMTNVPVTLLR